MFEWLFGSAKKEKEEEQVIEEETPPRITFEVHKGGEIFIYSSWPTPTTREDALDITRAMANMIVLTQTGRLLHAVQRSVIDYGRASDIQKEMSKNIMMAIQVILENQGNLQLPLDERPVVSPSEAFQVRGGN